MVISLIGRADNYDLVFSQNEQGQWETIVPVDLTDGMYVIELWATDESGNIGYYTGFLYLFDGRMTQLELLDEKFSILISSGKFILDLKERSFNVFVSYDKYQVDLSERMVVIV